MPGGSERHDLFAGLIYQHRRRCPVAWLPTVHLQPVRPNGHGNAYYPDVFVARGSAPHGLYESSPALVVEVLSRSTADRDRREKAVAYAGSGYLSLLLLVDPDAPRIEAARPSAGQIGTWAAYGPGDVVATEFGDIDVDALYDVVDRIATTPQHPATSPDRPKPRERRVGAARLAALDRQNGRSRRGPIPTHVCGTRARCCRPR